MKVRLGLAGLLLLGLAGCDNEPKPLNDKQIFALIKASTINRQVDLPWATGIRNALDSLDLKVNQSNSCAVIAVIEQESSFNADPEVSNIRSILYKKLNSIAEKPIIGHLLDMRLDAKAANGKTFRQNIAQIRTERQMGDWYQEFTAASLTAPLLSMMDKDLDSLIGTVGSMQVSINFSRQFASDHGISTYDMRKRLFSRDGGIFFGTAHLLKGEQNYQNMEHYFADFNAGHFASRNAAFQHMVATLSGIKLLTDGDLMDYSLETPSTYTNSFKATVAALEKQGEYANKKQIEADFRLEKKAKFSESDTYKTISRLYAAKHKQAIPAMLPNIDLKSEKISRKLTTAWFAQRVNSRYSACMRVRVPQED